MTSRETPSGSQDRPHVRTSRRTFLTMAGSAAGIGLSAAPVSGAAVDVVGNRVTVNASPAERDVTQAVVDRLEESDSPGTVSLDVTETTAGMRRFTAGDIDVLAGSRPILSAERSRAVQNGIDYDHREFPTATATLRCPESAWVDCLRPGRLAETWARDGAGETWAEVAPPAATEGVTRHRPSGESTAETVAGEYSIDQQRPTQDGSVLVRGVRAYQYASGFGGVGYYEPDDDWLGQLGASSERDEESQTPIVRLAFLYVDRDSLRRQAVQEFVRAYTRQSGKRVGSVPYFENPVGGDER